MSNVLCLFGENVGKGLLSEKLRWGQYSDTRLHFSTRPARVQRGRWRGSLWKPKAVAIRQAVTSG